MKLEAKQRLLESSGVDLATYDAFLRHVFLEEPKKSKDLISAARWLGEWFSLTNNHDKFDSLAVEPITAVTYSGMTERLMSLITNVWGRCPIPKTVYRATGSTVPLEVGQKLLYKHHSRPVVSWSLAENIWKSSVLRDNRLSKKVKYEALLSANPRGCVIWVPESLEVMRSLNKYTRTVSNASWTSKSSASDKLRDALITFSVVLDNATKTVAVYKSEQEVVLYMPDGIQSTVIKVGKES